MEPRRAFAYLAEGKLYLSNRTSGDSGPSQQIDSPFVQGILDRSARDRQRNDWKTGTTGWSFASRGMPGLRGAMAHPETRRVRYTGIAPGNSAAELIYALEMDQVGGLFLFDARENHERRLFHRNQFVASDVSRHSVDGTLAISLKQHDGASNIATLAADGKGIREITEGDSMDQCPAWVPGARKLVFQSAGIGRDAAGGWRGLGPYAIQQIDLDRGDLSTLLEDDHFDYLCPRADEHGTTYCIRRPYQPHTPVSPLKALTDVLLFPIRLARAVIHFLDFFSLMFSRKPLLTAGGVPKEGPDARYMMLWGKLIDAEKARNATGRAAEAPLVPSSWELVRFPAGAAEQVLANGVISFDLCADGLIYTNGNSIFHRSHAGDMTKVLTGRMIERVVSLPDGN